MLLNQRVRRSDVEAQPKDFIPFSSEAESPYAAAHLSTRLGAQDADDCVVHYDETSNNGYDPDGLLLFKIGVYGTCKPN